METFSFSCCENMIIHIKRVVFQILWTILGILSEVFLKFSQLAGSFEKISQPDEN